MPWSSAQLSADELALFAAGKPCLCAVVGRNPDDVQFRTSGSWASGSDGTASGFPTVRAYDGKPHLITKAASSQTDWYLIYDFSTSPITFDAFAIMGHGASLDAMALVVDVSDNDDFTSSQTVASFSPDATGDRLADWVLFHTGSTALRYSDVPYVRVYTSLGSHLPQYGEVMFLRRRQLKHHPSVPWDQDGLRSSSSKFVSRSGVITNVSHSEGRRDMSATIHPWETPYTTDVVSWFGDIDHGTGPFVWSDDPNADANDFHLMYLQDPSLDYPLVGPTERSVTIRAMEQGPQSFYKAKE